MATKQPAQASPTPEFTVSPHSRGVETGPEIVRVEIVDSGKDSLTAILPGKEYGRYRFDFTPGTGMLHIERAYENGEHINETEFPDWVNAVREAILERFEA